jgi:class 3 adenylate cyclase
MSDGAVILFADLVDSSQYARSLGGRPYASLIKEYQAVARNIFWRRVGVASNPSRHVWEVRGDEAFLILRGQPDSRIGWALLIALELKLRWYLGKTNLRRALSDGQDVIDVGIGIHAGKVTERRDFAAHYEPAHQLVVGRQSGRGLNRRGSRFVRGRIVPDISLEGFHINLAKRVEGESRHTDTRVAASDSAWELIIKGRLPWTGRRQPALQVRGVGVTLEVTELTGVRLSRPRYTDYLRGTVFHGARAELSQAGLFALNTIHGIRPRDTLLGSILAQVYDDVGDLDRAVYVRSRCG